MFLFLLACQGEKTNTTNTYTELDTSEELVDTEDEPTDTGSTTEPEETTTYQLSVEQGYGAGAYEAGDVVHVFADFLPGNEVVTHWSGDLDLS